MRMMPAVFMALSLALALSLLTLSGVGAHLGQEPGTSLEEQVEATAEDQEEIEVDPDAGDGSFLGSTVSALEGAMSVVSIIVFFPSALETLGAPSWFARIVGHGFQILVGLGIAQIVRGTEIA